ncbi:MAG: radical SAM family heme chaperone HemW [Oscillospiraceae bacterium]|nr:radical SAM family heme chaperone HemW [Oscillospiraceae bacterium]
MAFFLTGKRKEKKKLGIYVHIPFCKSKCEYCDFYSIGGGRDKRLTDDYLQTLADHIKETGALAPDYRVDTVYFGGGTPSFFGAENLEKILDEIHRHFRLTSDAEITAEANPDSVTLSGLRRMLRAGFNRLSIGVQSDDDEMLKKLGRPHNFQQAKQAMELARKAGFANISLDLMYGLPNQTVSQWKETVLNIISLRPEHISCYGLKVEENTPLWSYKDCANLPNDDAQAQMYLEAVKLLEEYGYEQYEISNFAKKGFHSRHNMKYWTGEEYLGFGPNAASDFGGRRFTIIRDLKRYISGIANEQAVLDENEEIPMRERAGEYIMLRLRTAQGICREEYEKQYLLPFRPLEEELRHYADNGLAKQVGKRWRLTPSGWLLSNQIILQLLEIQSNAGTLSKKNKE